jgi:hypothetical protein
MEPDSPPEPAAAEVRQKKAKRKKAEAAEKPKSRKKSTKKESAKKESAKLASSEEDAEEMYKSQANLIPGKYVSRIRYW